MNNNNCVFTVFLGVLNRLLSKSSILIHDNDHEFAYIRKYAFKKLNSVIIYGVNKLEELSENNLVALKPHIERIFKLIISLVFSDSNLTHTILENDIIENLITFTFQMLSASNGMEKMILKFLSKTYQNIFFETEKNLGIYIMDENLKVLDTLTR
ncbi:hypothetical protein RF11_08322 [Thelohanellus kitauei]|uniref:Uncharacterized protein n=1 Tax=Thelohanellus kitauei TaxID=669202 RepID=A0A0C2MT41_THEKT|nr:hypothetical protein RF11_08322 [Thelohanellus kitauei]